MGAPSVWESPVVIVTFLLFYTLCSGGRIFWGPHLNHLDIPRLHYLLFLKQLNRAFFCPMKRLFRRTWAFCGSLLVWETEVSAFTASFIRALRGSYVIQEFGKESLIQFYHRPTMSTGTPILTSPNSPPPLEALPQQRTMNTYEAVALCCPLVVSWFTSVLFRTCKILLRVFPAVIRSGDVFFLRCSSDCFFYAQMLLMVSPWHSKIPRRKKMGRYWLCRNRFLVG